MFGGWGGDRGGICTGVATVWPGVVVTPHLLGVGWGGGEVSTLGRRRSWSDRHTQRRQQAPSGGLCRNHSKPQNQSLNTAIGPLFARRLHYRQKLHTVYHWFNVGPALQMLAQNWPSIEPASAVASIGVCSYPWLYILYYPGHRSPR